MPINDRTADRWSLGGVADLKPGVSDAPLRGFGSRALMPSKASLVRRLQLRRGLGRPEPLLPEQQRDLLEIVEDRYNAGSLIITSQLPVDRWYELVGNPTLADAILDRIVHNAYRVELSGESLRKPKAFRLTTISHPCHEPST